MKRPMSRKSNRLGLALALASAALLGLTVLFAPACDDPDDEDTETVGEQIDADIAAAEQEIQAIKETIDRMGREARAEYKPSVDELEATFRRAKFAARDFADRAAQAADGAGQEAAREARDALDGLKESLAKVRRSLED